MSDAKVSPVDRNSQPVVSRFVRNDVFVLDASGQPAALRGSRCTRCGSIEFPCRLLCPCCGLNAAVVDHALSDVGRIHSCTVARVRSALGHHAPRAYGYVELLADRTRVFAPLQGADVDLFAPGLAVRLAFSEIDAPGLAGVIGYSFVPFSQGGRREQ